MACWNPARGVWETRNRSACGHLEPYSAIWPVSGSMRNGCAYAHRRPERHTGETGPSSWPTAPLLKTPTSNLGSNGGSQHPDKRKQGGHGPTLADEVEWALLPTPSASNPNGSEPLDRWEARRRRNLAKKINGNGQGMPLGIAVRTLTIPGAESPGDATSPSSATGNG